MSKIEFWYDEDEEGAGVDSGVENEDDGSGVEMLLKET
jgi:hypothetical protein